jgi:hypothetical protein
MRALRCCGWLATCLIISLLAQPSAVAAKRRPVTRAGDLAGFALRGSDGYSIQVLTLGRRFVTLTASKGHVGAVYSTRGRISGNRITARFGNLGRIAVRFHASRPPGGRETAPSRRCTGEGGGPQAGTFRGTIRFTGERGYTRVDAHRAKGAALRAERGACTANRRAGPSAALPLARLTTHLTAVSKRAGRVVSIDVLGFRNPRLWVQASTQEQRGRMRIARLAYAVVGGPSAFVSSGPGEHPAFAVLTPPKPFSGTGLFQEGGDLSNGWTGTLSAWLPGAGKVSLAGPTFASSFCRRAPDGSGCALFPPVRRRIRIAQDSGSQSQALWDTRLSWSR